MLPGFDALPLKREFKRLMMRSLNAFAASLLNSPNAAAARSALGAAASGDIGSSGLTMATDRLLGRTTAGVGAPEQVSVGAGLSLAAGSLALDSVSAPPPVRQTVLSGPVDTNGLPSFGGSTGSTTVTASGTLIPTAANGTANRTGSITNPSWTGLSTNGTMFLYLDIAANGTCTPGSTTLEPTYREGGADVTTNGQFTFNIGEMVGKVGNGSVANQVYRVFVGQVTVAGGVVTAIVWYALRGRYAGAFVGTLPTGVVVSANHNIGQVPGQSLVEIRCLTPEFGYSIGDVVQNVYTQNTSSVWPPITVGKSPLATWFTFWTSGNTWGIQRKDTVGIVTPTLANWAYRMTSMRGW